MIAITNVRLWTDEGEFAKNGTVIFAGGKIKDAGVGIEPPEGAEIVNGRGKYATPGLIDAHSHVGNFGEGTGIIGFDANEATEAVTPHARAIDGVDPFDKGFEDARAGGVTTVCVLPGSANVIGGLGAVVKTAGTVVDDMVVAEPCGLKVAFGENPKVTHGEKRSPKTRMGVASVFREAFSKALDYDEKMKREPEKRPDRDIRMESILGCVRGEYPLRAHAHRADDIATSVRLAKEFGVAIVSDHCTSGYLIADYLAENNVPCVVGPNVVGRFKQELKDKNYELPGILEKTGCTVALATDHPFMPIDTLRVVAALARRDGMSETGAIAGMTSTAASILGLSERVGRLAPGYDADIVLWTGHPLASVSQVYMTIIDGETVYERKLKRV
ncbi:MAG: amidohydrolase [Candidatus Coatesbacteria bacterium]|nr:MAG: amidohydrolase [Candidatus Coatesbacteria bacterium]